MTYLSDEATLDLAIEILKQAYKDYKLAYKLTKYGGKSIYMEDPEYELIMCEKFYRGEWFIFLTLGKADGERVMKDIREEVDSEALEKAKKIRFTHPSERDAVRSTDGKVQESEIARYWGAGSSFY